MPQHSLNEASKGLGDLTSYANKLQSFGGNPGVQTQQFSQIGKSPKADKKGAKRTTGGTSFPEETNLRQQCYATVFVLFMSTSNHKAHAVQPEMTSHFHTSGRTVEGQPRLK